jgi:hypothetical protein
VAILSKLRAHFEEKFRYDVGGVPKVWKPEDDIDGAFKVAKQDVREDLGTSCRVPATGRLIMSIIVCSSRPST